MAENKKQPEFKDFIKETIDTMPDKNLTEEKKFLRQAILSSFPDLLAFDLSLNNYKQFVKQEATKELLNDYMRFLERILWSELSKGLRRDIEVKIEEVKQRLKQNGN